MLTARLSRREGGRKKRGEERIERQRGTEKRRRGADPVLHILLDLLDF